MDRSSWLLLGDRYRLDRGSWLLLGDRYRLDRGSWLLLGDRYRLDWGSWLLLDDRYRVDRSSWLLLGDRYRVDRSSWLLLAARYRMDRSSWLLRTPGTGSTIASLRRGKGMTYRFPKLSAPLDRGSSAATSPIDVSCKELFLRVGGPSPNVFRVPLDALPEGTPPSQPPAPLAISDAGTTAPSREVGKDAGAADAGR